MPTKKEIQDQIDALTASLDTAEDDHMSVTRRTLSDGTVEEVYKVPKSHPHLSWLFGEKKDDEGDGGDGGDGDGGENKSEPAPKGRNKFFGD